MRQEAEDLGQAVPGRRRFTTLASRLWRCLALLACGLPATAHAGPAVAVSPPSLLDDPPRMVPGTSKPVGLASDGTGWLFAYQPANELGSETGLFVRAISADGAPLGSPQPVGNCPLSGAQLSFDGSEYLLSYSDGCPQPSRWNLLRIGTDGVALAAPQIVADASSVSNVALAAGDGTALLVLCGEQAACRTKVMSSDGALHNGVTLSDIGAYRGSPVAAYSDGTYLVAIGRKLLLFGQDGHPLDVTLTAPVGAPTTIDPDADGFAIAWTEADAIHLAHVAFDGTVKVAQNPLSTPRGSLEAPRLRRFSGVRYVAAREWPIDCNCFEQVLQRLTEDLEPDGGLGLAMEGANYAEPSATAAFGVTGTPDYPVASYQRGRLLHFGAVISGEPLRDVSFQPHSQRQILGAPAKDGWLATWQEIYTSRSGGRNVDLRGVRLLPNGKPAAPSMLLESGDVAEYSDVEALSRGHDSWLLALTHNVSSHESGRSLALLKDGVEALHPVPGSELGQPDSWGVKLAGSDLGWLMLHQGRVDGAPTLLATRLDVDGREIDTTPLAQGSRYSVRLDGDHYLACWVDSYVRCRNLPIEGPIPDESAKKLFPAPDGVSSPILTASGSECWAVLDRWIYGSSLPEPQSVKALKGEFIDALVLGDQLLLASGDYGTHQRFDLGVVAPGQDFMFLAETTAPAEAHFSEPQGNRALLLGYQPYPYEGFGRAMASVIEVAGDEPIVGGAGGERGLADAGGEGGTPAQDVGAGGQPSSSTGGSPDTDDSSAEHASRPDEPSSNACTCGVVGSAHGNSPSALMLFALVGLLSARRRRPRGVGIRS
ncbi:MAG: hypothetical protein ABUL60_27675 [Myxococcales bacterium]